MLPSQRFACSYPGCTRSYVQKKSLNEHKKTHTVGNTMACPKPECSYTCLYPSELRKHARTHTGETPFACDTCDEKFKRKENLTRHMLIHTGVKAFKCDTCSKCFREKRNLKVHEETHTEKKAFKCHTCSKRFRQKSNLKVHEETHTEKKAFKCHTCSKRFRQKSHLKAHIKRKHSDINPDDETNVDTDDIKLDMDCGVSSKPIFDIDDIEFDFSPSPETNNTAEALPDQSSPPKDAWPVIADDIEFDFSPSPETNNTVEALPDQSYPPKDAWPVITMDASSPSSSSASRHSRSRTTPEAGGKLSKCPQCDYATRDKSNLKRHIRRKHSRVNPADASTQQSLRSEPFVCGICYENYTRKASLERHMLTHQGVKPFACPQTGCSKCYTRKTNLIAHIKSKHSGVNLADTNTPQITAVSSSSSTQLAFDSSSLPVVVPFSLTQSAAEAMSIDANSSFPSFIPAATDSHHLDEMPAEGLPLSSEAMPSQLYWEDPRLLLDGVSLDQPWEEAPSSSNDNLLSLPEAMQEEELSPLSNSVDWNDYQEALAPQEDNYLDDCEPKPTTR